MITTGLIEVESNIDNTVEETCIVHLVAPNILLEKSHVLVVVETQCVQLLIPPTLTKVEVDVTKLGGTCSVGHCIKSAPAGGEYYNQKGQ